MLKLEKQSTNKILKKYEKMPDEIEFLKKIIKALKTKESYIKSTIPHKIPDWVEEILYEASIKYGDLTKIILLFNYEKENYKESESYYKGTSQ